MAGNTYRNRRRLNHDTIDNVRPFIDGRGRDHFNPLSRTTGQKLCLLGRNRREDGQGLILHLRQAVNELRGQDLGAPVDPEIKTTTTAYLSDTYIPDANQRLMAYKRLASVRNEDELDDAVRLLADRYGRLPEAAAALVETLQVRVLALQLGLAKVEQGPAAVALTLHEKGLLQPEHLLPLINARGSVWRLTPEMVLSRPLTKKEQEDPLAGVQALLRDLVRYAKSPGSVTIDVLAEPEPPPQQPKALEAPRNSGRRRVVSGRW